MPGIDILDLLVHEHNEVKDMLSEVQDWTSDIREDLYRKIEKSLKAHTEKEEEFLYLVLTRSDSGEARVLSIKALEEHNAVKTLLNGFKKVSPGSEGWQAKILVLNHMVEDHIESEEKELFPLAKKVMKMNRGCFMRLPPVLDFRKM